MEQIEIKTVNITRMILTNAPELATIINDYRSRTGVMLIQDAMYVYEDVAKVFPTYSHNFVLLTAIWLMVLSSPKNFEYMDAYEVLGDYCHCTYPQGDHPPLFNMNRVPLIIDKEFHDEVRSLINK